MRGKDNPGADEGGEFDLSRAVDFVNWTPVRLRMIDTLLDNDQPMSASELFEIHGDEL